MQEGQLAQWAASTLPEILEVAADQLDQPDAWCQRETYSFAKGDRVIAACLVGGVQTAAVKVLGDGWYPHVVDAAAQALLVSGNVPARGPAEQGLAKLPNTADVVAWNDAVGRTQSDVVDALKLTAKYLRNQEGTD